MKKSVLPPRNYDECVFCDIVLHDKKQQVEWRGFDSVAITPHYPIVPGHRLIIPARHARDAVENPNILAYTMLDAVEFTRQQGIEDCNIIINVGRAAEQTVFHLHVHIIPRSKNDGLLLPWSHLEYRKLPYPETDDCMFCRIATIDEHQQVQWRGYHSIAMTPFGPVVPGHRVVISTAHIQGVLTDPEAMVRMMYDVEWFVKDAGVGEFNLIINVGNIIKRKSHILVHVIPREEGDDIALPWTNQARL